MTKKHPSSHNTILHAVCARGHAHIGKYLLKFCCSKAAMLPSAIFGDPDETLDINAMNNERKTPLHLAAERGTKAVFLKNNDN